MSLLFQFVFGLITQRVFKNKQRPCKSWLEMMLLTTYLKDFYNNCFFQLHLSQRVRVHFSKIFIHFRFKKIYLFG